MNTRYFVCLCCIIVAVNPVLGYPIRGPDRINWKGETLQLVQLVDDKANDFILVTRVTTNSSDAHSLEFEKPVFVYQQKYQEVRGFSVNQSGDLIGLWLRGKTTVDRRNKILICHLDGGENRYHKHHLINKRSDASREAYQIQFIEVDHILRNEAITQIPNANLHVPIQYDLNTFEFISDDVLQFSGVIESKMSFEITLQIIDEAIKKISVTFRELIN